MQLLLRALAEMVLCGRFRIKVANVDAHSALEKLVFHKFHKATVTRTGTTNFYAPVHTLDPHSILHKLWT